MSGKNRAFALAVATAALVGFSAPVASAATFGGGPNNNSGFNNDSIVNVSGNQVPLQACNNDIPINAGFLAGQGSLADIAAALGLMNSGSATVNDNRNCTQTPTQTDPTTVTSTATSSDPSKGNDKPNGNCNSCGSSSWQGSGGQGGNNGTNNSGFNGDSILNVSNNQVPVQACNNDIPINAGAGVIQGVVEDASAAVGLLGNSGNATTNDNRNCTQVPSQNNPNTTTSTASSS
jgi:hypothetical protein